MFVFHGKSFWKDFCLRFFFFFLEKKSLICWIETMCNYIAVLSKTMSHVELRELRISDLWLSVVLVKWPADIVKKDLFIYTIAYYEKKISLFTCILWVCKLCMYATLWLYITIRSWVRFPSMLWPHQIEPWRDPWFQWWSDSPNCVGTKTGIQTGDPWISSKVTESYQFQRTGHRKSNPTKCNIIY
jgi:hypothetical protein